MVTEDSVLVAKIQRIQQQNFTLYLDKILLEMVNKQITGELTRNVERQRTHSPMTMTNGMRK